MQMAKDDPVNVFRCEGQGRHGVVVRIADHESAVGTLHNDQVDAIRQRITRLGLQPGPQGDRLRQVGVAPIPHQAQVTHHRCGQVEPHRRTDPQHLQLREAQVEWRKPRACHTGQHRPRTDNHARRLDHSSHGPQAIGSHVKDGFTPPERHAVGFGKPTCEAWHRLTRLDPKFVGRMHGTHRTIHPQFRCPVANVGRPCKFTPMAHRRASERLKDRPRLGPVRGKPKASLEDRYPGEGRNLLPDIP